jgi:hypothetical protein
VSDFLNDRTTFKDPNERMAQLRGLQVQLTYEPVYSGKQPRSKAAQIEARIKTITGTGQSVSEQKFILSGRNGEAEKEITVLLHFQSSKSYKPYFALCGVIRSSADLRSVQHHSTQF